MLIAKRNSAGIVDAGHRDRAGATQDGVVAKLAMSIPTPTAQGTGTEQNTSVRPAKGDRVPLRLAVSRTAIITHQIAVITAFNLGLHKAVAACRCHAGG
jgi:hypothetical protein